LPEPDMRVEKQPQALRWQPVARFRGRGDDVAGDLARTLHRSTPALRRCRWHHLRDRLPALGDENGVTAAYFLEKSKTGFVELRDRDGLHRSHGYHGHLIWSKGAAPRPFVTRARG